MSTILRKASIWLAQPDLVALLKYLGKEKVDDARLHRRAVLAALGFH